MTRSPACGGLRDRRRFLGKADTKSFGPRVKKRTAGRPRCLHFVVGHEGEKMIRIIPAVAVILLCGSNSAFSWGDEGHKAIALLAQQCLPTEANNKISAMLDADTDSLTAHDTASEATWADKYRDSNNRKDHYEQTKNWHFTDIEIDAPDLNAACFGRPPLPSGTAASMGPARACAVDKVEQFEKELSAPNTDPAERLLALKFILHFIGDIHQPLHSSDNHDSGGNDIKVEVDGFFHQSRDELHGFWDTQFVEGIASSPASLVAELSSQITPADAAAWANGSPDNWAMETFSVAKADTYGNPPLDKMHTQHLSATYVDIAELDVRLQLGKAGVRLATVLARDLGTQPIDWAACLRGQ
jgi:hypothetical protein